MFSFTLRRKRRRPSLTPMIDVVFLLLVFFMLAARYGQDIMRPLGIAAGQSKYEGPPRLVQIAPASIALNGQTIDVRNLSVSLAELMSTPQQVVLLQPLPGTDLQRLINVVDTLAAAGITNVTVVPAR